MNREIFDGMLGRRGRKSGEEVKLSAGVACRLLGNNRSIVDQPRTADAGRHERHHFRRGAESSSSVSGSAMLA